MATDEPLAVDPNDARDWERYEDDMQPCRDQDQNNE